MLLITTMEILLILMVLKHSRSSAVNARHTIQMEPLLTHNGNKLSYYPVFSSLLLLYYSIVTIYYLYAKLLYY